VAVVVAGVKAIARDWPSPTIIGLALLAPPSSIILALVKLPAKTFGIKAKLTSASSSAIATNNDLFGRSLDVIILNMFVLQISSYNTSGY
jgi:hypothetical protein